MRESGRFIGRGVEIDELGALVASGSRLVTVVGPGGAGKTRLALAATSRMEASRAATLFCDLSESQTTGDVLRAVGNALGIPLTLGATTSDVATQIAHVLAAKGPTTVVLDNFEQVAERATGVVEQWVTELPRATFLVTSREPLRLADEAVFPLGPMSVIDGALLFEDRVRRARHGGRLGTAERPLVASIVRKLDGIPLAIELAAARAGVLGLADLDARLAKRFEVLRSLRRGASARHTTLERAIAWSWDLLTPWERAALAECSVFRGGFDAAAAEAVVDVSAFREGPATLDVVASLRDKSLLQAGPDAAGTPRFWLLESIREYAASKLDERDGARARVRHARHYVPRAEKWARATEGALATENLAHLGAELENLLAVVHRSLEPTPELAVRAVLALDALLGKRGPFETHFGLLTEAERAARRLRDPIVRASVLRVRAVAARLRGDWDGASADLDAALRLLAQHGRGRAGKALTASVLTTRGQIELDRGHPERGRARLRRALKLARQSGNDRAVAQALCTLGGATEIFAEALPLVRRLGDLRIEARVLANWGRFDREQGRLDVASKRLEGALRIARELEDRPMESALSMNVALLHHVREDRRRSRAAYEEAIRLNRLVGNRRVESLAWTYLGILLYDDGALHAAQEALVQALASAGNVGDAAAQGLPLGQLAAVAAARDDIDGARALMARAKRCTRGARDAVTIASLGVVEGHIDLAFARRARQAGKVEAAAHWLGAAARRVAVGGSDARARPFGTAETVALVQSRILARAMMKSSEPERAAPASTRSPRSIRARAAAPLGGTRAAAPLGHLTRTSGRTLDTSTDAAWFRTDGAPKVSLGGRRPLRRVLARLVERHLDTPGDAVAASELIAAGWPGERLRKGAALNRLHNAIASLRALGLRDRILTRTDGYLLEPKLVVEIRHGAE